MNQEDYKRKKRLVIIFLIIEIIIIILLLAYCSTQKVDAGPSNTALIEKTEEPLYEPEIPGQIEVKVNSYALVSGGIMRDLNLCNTNKGLRLKGIISIDDRVIYESNYISPGEVLEDDYVKTDGISRGEHEALLEMKYFDENDQMVGQSNAIITMNFT